MKCAFICVAISLSLPVFGQSLQQSTSDKTLPDSPSATKVLADNTRATPFVSQPLRPAVPALVIQSAPPKEKKRVADRSFILSSLFQIGATIGDIESTQYGLGHGVREGNPLFGSRPSRAKQYGIALPVAAAVVGWSYRLKKSAPHSKHWLIPPVIVGSMHAAALGHNLMVITER
jgi:hypothetical protein